MPDPSSLTTLQAEILSIDLRNDRDNQRIADIRAGQDARQKIRDELAAQIVRAMKASEITGNYVDGPQRTIWWLASGKLRYESVVSGAAISIPTVASAPPVSAPAPATPTTAPAFPANDQTIEAAEFGPRTTQSSNSASRYLDRLTFHVDGEPRVRSNGMLVELVIGMRLAGMSCDGIVRAHPGLIIADVIACDDWYVARGGRTEDFPDVAMKAVSGGKGDNGAKAATGNGVPTEVTTS